MWIKWQNFAYSGHTDLDSKSSDQSWTYSNEFACTGLSFNYDSSDVTSQTAFELIYISSSWFSLDAVSAVIDNLWFLSLDS